MSSIPETADRREASLRDVLPQLTPEILEAKARALLGALGAQELSIARRLLPPVDDDLHPPFEILITVERATLGAAEPPPPQAFDRLLGEGCSYRLDGTAAGVLAGWVRENGGGALCGWALPHDALPSVAIVARVGPGWDPGEVRLRVGRRGMDALARSLCPPSWWLSSGPVTPPPRSAERPLPRVVELASLRDAKLRVERELLQRALRGAGGNKAEAARRLKLSRQGLYRKLRRHGLHPKS